MLNSKLLQLYQSLSEEECIACAAFVRSSVFNQSKDVVLLWNFLQRQRKAQRINKLTKAQVFSFLFADAPYSDIKLRNLIRKLTKVIESFLIQHELQLNPIDREVFLNTIYRKRNLFDLFEKSGKRLAKILDQETERGSDYFLKQYHWRKQYYFHPRTIKDSQSVEQLRVAYQHLSQYFEIERLHMEVELRNQERIYAKMYDPTFFNTETSGSIASDLLQLVSQLIQTQDLEIYNTLKTLFYENLEALSEGDRNVIYAGMLNFVIASIPKDEKQLTLEAFELYQLGIDSEILLSDGKITGTTFLNIVIAGSRIKELDWVATFLTHFKEKISSPHASEYLTISESYYFFAKKDWNKTHEILTAYEFKNQQLNLNAKSILCKVYFELNLYIPAYSEVLESTILAFEKYLRRQANISTRIKQSYLNFIFSLFTLYKFQQKKGKNKKDLKKIFLSIQQEKNIFNRSWLSDHCIRLANTSIS